jgi:hypothetical protein
MGLVINIPPAWQVRPMPLAPPLPRMHVHACTLRGPVLHLHPAPHRVDPLGAVWGPAGVARVGWSGKGRGVPLADAEHGGVDPGEVPRARLVHRHQTLPQPSRRASESAQ